MLWLRALILLAAYGKVQSIELKGLQLLVSVLTGDFMETKNKDDDETPIAPTVTDGHTNYTFIDFVTFPGKRICDSDDPAKTLNSGTKSDRRPAIKIKCLRGRGDGNVHVVASMKEVVSILAPHGNYSTKRNVEGNCTLILFYARTCAASAAVAPHFNALARQFPDIKIAAIDAFTYHSFNTEFGIVGLPTIMLFHQGRPIVRYNHTTSTVNHFANFITKRTGIKPVSSSAYVTSDDFNGPLSSKVENEPDFYLYLAWAFILICAGYYFTKSKLYTQIIEMIKRNWRESEAQHEHGS